MALFVSENKGDLGFLKIWRRDRLLIATPIETIAVNGENRHRMRK